MKGKSWIFCICLSLVFAGTVSAVDWTNANGTGRWDDPLNWDGPTGPGIEARIGLPGQPALIDGATAAQAGHVFVGTTNSGQLDMTGGTLDYNGWLAAGNNGNTGIVNVSGGTINGGGGQWYLGGGSSSGEFHMSGNATFNMSSGMAVGWSGGGSGTLTITDNASIIGADGFWTANEAGNGNPITSVIDISGFGSLTTTGGANNRLGQGGPGTTTMTISENGSASFAGGRFEMPNLNVAHDAYLTLNDDASFTMNGDFASGRSTTNVGNVTVNDGTFTVTNTVVIGEQGGDSVFQVNGGEVHFSTLGDDLWVNCGRLQIDGGVVYAYGNVNIRPGWGVPGPVDGTIDITGGKIITNDADLGKIGWFVGQGDYLTGYGDAANIRFDHDVTTPGMTTIWAVPEPATMLLLGCGSLAFLRRLRR